MLRDIVERDTAKPTAPTLPSAPSPSTSGSGSGSGSTGFPTIVHRSQRTSKRPSAFASRNARSGPHIGNSVDTVPTLQAAASSISEAGVGGLSRRAGGQADDGHGVERGPMSEMERVRRDVDSENMKRVESMSKEEREREVEELKERFGGGLVDIMRKRREARLAAINGGTGATSSSTPSIVADTTRPDGRMVHDATPSRSDPPTGRGEGLTEAQKVYEQVDKENALRVESMSAEERQQEIGELEERFGKGIMDMLRKRALAKAGSLMSPADAIGGSADGVFDPAAPSSQETAPAKATGKTVRFDAPPQAPRSSSSPASPQKPLAQSSTSKTADPLARYFPDQQPEHSKLAWTQPPSSSSSTVPSNSTSAASTATTSSLRFDLSGHLLTPAQQADIPVSHGLHHHGLEPDLAGYTLDEMLLLARSTVVMQRVSMMDLLGKVMVEYLFSEEEGEMGADNAGGSEDIGERMVMSQVQKDKTAVMAEIARLGVLDKVVPLAIDIILGRRNVTLLGAAISLLYTALGGPTWSWLDDHPSLSTQSFRPFPLTISSYSSKNPDNATDTITLTLPSLTAIPFEDLLPVLSTLLSDSSYLEPASTQQLILNLRRAANWNPGMARVVLPLAMTILRAHTTSCAWPPAPVVTGSQRESKRDSMPLVAPLALLRDLVSASRVCAEQLHGARVTDGLLRFLVLKTWPSLSSGDAAESSGFPQPTADIDPHQQAMVMAQRAESAELATETLHLLSAFGRYGLGAALATGGMDLWRDLYADICRIFVNARVNEMIEGEEQDRIITAPLAVAYFDLVAVWTTCAIDPHRTTPEHDLTWSQMENMGWADQAVDMILDMSARVLGKGSKVREENTDGVVMDALYILSAALGALIAWAEGIKVNGIKQGQGEKAAIGNKLASSRLRDVFDLASGGESTLHQELVLRILQLHTRLAPPPAENVSSTLLSIEQVSRLSQRCTSPIPKGPLADTHAASAIAFELLRLPSPGSSETSSTTSTLSHLLTALPLLQTFIQGAEPLALDVLDSILHIGINALPADLRETTQIDKIGHKDGLMILRPLLQHAILADAKSVVGPTKVESAYLKATTSLRASPRGSGLGDGVQQEDEDDDEGEGSRRPSSGLPLASDWLFHPIGELLRSADSVALQQAPNDWSATETQLVRAALSLVALSMEISSATTGPASTTRRSDTVASADLQEDAEGFIEPGTADPAQVTSGEGRALDGGRIKGMSRSQILWGIMRVYMLEHQPVAGPTEGEVSRDDTVSALISRLMGYLSTVPPAEIHPSALASASIKPSESAYASAAANPGTPPIQTHRAPLELAAAPYLGSEPFFTFYQDLLSLFENSSFGDALFARVILAPMAFGLGYDAEYRKLVWANPNVLRLIKTSVADAPIESENADIGVRAYWSSGSTATVHGRQQGSARMEQDPEVLAAYGQALVRGWIRSELLEQIALRGLISFFYDSDNIQRDPASSKGAEEKVEALGKLRKGLMAAVFTSAPEETVRKLLSTDGRYTADVGDIVRGEELAARQQLVMDVCGDKVAARVSQIMSATKAVVAA